VLFAVWIHWLGADGTMVCLIIGIVWRNMVGGTMTINRKWIDSTRKILLTTQEDVHKDSRSKSFINPHRGSIHEGPWSERFTNLHGR
jgi:hypothetical protein